MTLFQRARINLEKKAKLRLNLKKTVNNENAILALKRNQLVSLMKTKESNIEAVVEVQD